MANYKIKFSFNGSYFYGTCMQPNRLTVQGSLKKAISELLNEDVKIKMCSRLDKGVHANEMVANFILHHAITPCSLLKALNTKLNHLKIYVHDCEIVDDNFDSLYDAQAKHYRYIISQHQQWKYYLDNLAWQINEVLDIAKLKEAAQLFCGKHDFASFGTNKLGTTIRIIDSLKISQQDHFIYIDVKGPGFLKNMVRMIVACLVNYAQDKFDLAHIHNLLQEPRKGKANDLAPAWGLHLIKVKY